MKTIIAGSRTIEDYELVERACSLARWSITEVISGTAAGVDRLGEQWAERHNKPIVRFPANWQRYGKRAGYMRNYDMAEHAEALVALWDRKSKGTAHMIGLTGKVRFDEVIDCFIGQSAPGRQGRPPKAVIRVW